HGPGAAAPGGRRFRIGLGRGAAVARQRAPAARTLRHRTPAGAAARPREAVPRPWLRLDLPGPDEEPQPPLVRDGSLRRPQQGPPLPRAQRQVEPQRRKDAKTVDGGTRRSPMPKCDERPKPAVKRILPRHLRPAQPPRPLRVFAPWRPLLVTPIGCDTGWVERAAVLDNRPAT